MVYYGILTPYFKTIVFTEKSFKQIVDLALFWASYAF